MNFSAFLRLFRRPSNELSSTSTSYDIGTRLLLKKRRERKSAFVVTRVRAVA